MFQSVVYGVKVFGKRRRNKMDRGQFYSRLVNQLKPFTSAKRKVPRPEKRNKWRSMEHLSNLHLRLIH